MTEFKRRQVKGAQVNMDLSPPPSHGQIALAILGLEGEEAKGRAIFGSSRWHGAYTANVLAHECGVEGARRGGRGAVKGSWSGTMSGSLRISPTLRAMARKGLLHEEYRSRPDYRRYYSLTTSGRKLAEQEAGKMGETEQKVLCVEGFDVEESNLQPIRPGDAMVQPGDKVEVAYDYNEEAFEGDKGVVQAVGFAGGPFYDCIVADVILEGMDEAMRLPQEILSVTS